jgi:hypothetical protein
MSLSPNATVETPYIQRLKALIRSRDPKHVALVKAVNAELCRHKTLSGQVHFNTALTNVSVQYANGLYIGTKLLPVVDVPHKSNSYFVYDKRSRLAYPDDELGARGSPNELNENRKTDTYSAKGYGYKEWVDGETLANQDAPLDEMVDATANLAEGIAFREELRIAAVMTTLANYGSNTIALAAGSRWDSSSGGDPIGAIQNATFNLWTGRGASKVIGFTSLNVMNVLSRHPAILDLFKYGGTAPGLATSAMIAKFFGLDDILVSDARKDTANEAQTASYARIWPDVFGVVRVATTPSLRSVSFGYTFRWKGIQTNDWFDPSLGTMGGYYLKSAVNEDHKVVAGDSGFLITTPVG